MKERRKAICPLLAVLILMAALLSPARAHGQSDDDDDTASNEARSYSSLSLTLDNQGGAEVELSLEKKPADWEPIRKALGRALHCSAANFSNPAPSRYELQAMQRMATSQRGKYGQEMADLRNKRLEGHCASVLRVDRLMVSGSLDLRPLAESLAQQGTQEMYLAVRHPKTSFERHSGAGFQSAFAELLRYSYALDKPVPSYELELAYGFRNSDLIRQGVISFGFLLIPIVVVLWTRRAALRMAASDPTAAWFSYFRALNLAVNGTIVIWLVARTSMQQGLLDLIDFRLGPGNWQSTVAHTLVIMVPPWLVYLVCLVLSYEVFTGVRGNQWKRSEFVLNQFFEAGAQWFPWMFIFAGMLSLGQSPKLAVAMFLASYFSRVLCLRGKMKYSVMAPEVLTTGPLRDRIFELAKKGGVAVKQVVLMSAGRGQIANAYAAKNGIVMFTDYLLRRLNRREVDAVAAHELSHLRHKHPGKLGMALVAAVLMPQIFRFAWGTVAGLLMGALIGSTSDPAVLQRIAQLDMRLLTWPQLDLVLVVLGFGGYFLLARHFERVADEGCVQLSGDAEAMITALLKISRLNLMPIQWSKATGATLTHPATLKRINHIAETGNIAPERVQQLVNEYQAQVRGAEQVAAAEDGYALPTPTKRVLNTAVALRKASNNLWILIAGHIIPAALVAFAVARFTLSGQPALMAYLAGGVLSVAVYSLLTGSLGLRGRSRLQDSFRKKFEEEGIAVRGRNAVLAGFSPGAQPRFYLSSYNWDTGFLWMLQDRLVYLGDQMRFALKPQDIASLRLGQAAPGWWSAPRLCVEWQEANTGRKGSFNLAFAGPCSLRGLKKSSAALLLQLQEWSKKAQQYPAIPPALQSLESPVIGEVTSLSPKKLMSTSKNVSSTVLIMAVGTGLCTLLGVASWYVWSVVLVLRVYERIPYWRFREKAKPAQLAAPLAPAISHAARAVTE